MNNQAVSIINHMPFQMKNVKNVAVQREVKSARPHGRMQSRKQKKGQNVTKHLKSH